MVTGESLSELAGQYFGGLAHCHTILSNHKGHRESNLTAERLVQVLIEARLTGSPTAPLQYVMLNEHPSDPSHPQRLGRFSLRAQQLLRQRRRRTIHHVPVLHGLEVSLLASGHTDLTPRLADDCAMVIASRHTLPPPEERDPAAIMALFRQACYNPHVDVLGHPPRYIEDLAKVNWLQVFAWAAETGTAVEVNLNVFPTRAASPLQQNFWQAWLKNLAASKAHLSIGTDIHNQDQLNGFIVQWRSLEHANRHPDNQLARLLQALAGAGINPNRVITSSYDRLTAWLGLDKTERAQLP